jgi:hypothetical protein
MLKRFLDVDSLDDDEEGVAGGGEKESGMTICGLLWV